MKLVEYLHIIGSIVGLLTGIPAILKNVKGRNLPIQDNPLNQVSVEATALMAFASFGRLPNVIRGILSAIKKGDMENIRRFGLIIFATFNVGLVFYLTLVLMSIYMKTPDDKQKKNKHIAQVCTAVIGCMLICIISYFLYGLYN